MLVPFFVECNVNLFQILQMISPGCSFTFDGLKQTLLALEGGIEKKLKKVEHLLVNYRTTKDILTLGNQILGIARASFPGAIDYTKPERARKDLGLKVALCSWSAAFGTKAKFGDDQAFIYSSSKSCDLLRDAKVWLDDHPFILSSLESKGLEFLDIGELRSLAHMLWYFDPFFFVKYCTTNLLATSFI